MRTATLKYNTTALTKAVTKRHEWMSRGNVSDSIVEDRDLPSNVKYMVVDLETHDWTHRDPLLASGCIVEIAWKLFSDTGDCLESKQYLIKPYGTYKQIAKKATEVHGITTERASKHGDDVELILDEFIRIVENIPKDGFVIAHNMDHEHTVLTNSFSPDQRVVWDDVPKSNTHSVSLLKYLPREAKDKYKKCQFTLGNSNGYKLCSSSVAFKNKSGHLANNWLRACTEKILEVWYPTKIE